MFTRKTSNLRSFMRLPSISGNGPLNLLSCNFKISLQIKCQQIKRSYEKENIMEPQWMKIEDTMLT